jgi:hypothetical protein
MNQLTGVKVTWSPTFHSLGAGPLVAFPATEAERTRAAKEASKVAELLAKPSSAQVALFRHLAESSPDGAYVVTAARWIETIMKATNGFTEAEMNSLHDFDWSERSASAEDLRRELKAALKSKSSIE